MYRPLKLLVQTLATTLYASASIKINGSASFEGSIITLIVLFVLSQWALEARRVQPFSQKPTLKDIGRKGVDG